MERPNGLDRILGVENDHWEPKEPTSILYVCTDIASLIDQGYKFAKYQEYTANGRWLTVLKKEGRPDQTFELDEGFPFMINNVDSRTEQNFNTALAKIKELKNKKTEN